MRLGTAWMVSLLAVGALLAPCTTARAQGGEFDVDPAACVIAPIPMPLPGDTGDLATPSPTPTPVAVPQGDAADDDVAAAVSERIAMAIACQNAGDPLRLLANFTQRWVSERFAGYDLVFYSRFQAAAEHPQPLPEGERIELLSVDEVVVLSDYEVVATVTTRIGGDTQKSAIALVETFGEWLIDGGSIDPVTEKR